MRFASLGQAGIVAGLLAAASLWGAGSIDFDARQVMASPDATPGATPTAAHIVDIRYLRYAPDPIEIAAGESIEWVNRDALPHTVTSAEGEPLQSETLGLGDRYRQTFAEPGTYDYVCQFHAQMHGMVIVRDDAASPAAG